MTKKQSTCSRMWGTLLLVGLLTHCSTGSDPIVTELGAAGMGGESGGGGQVQGPGGASGGSSGSGAGGSGGATSGGSGSGGFGGEGKAGSAGTAGEGGSGAGGGVGGAGGAAGAEAGGAAGAGGGGECAGTGKAKVRVANLLPKGGKVDVCARKASDADFSGAKRLVRELGDAQHDGLAYPELSRGFEVDGGGWVLKVIDAAAADCSADALLEAPLCVGDKQDLSVLVLEGQITVFPNAGLTEGNRLRFLHAYAGEGPLDFGLVSDSLIPPPIFAGIGFGKTSPPGVTGQGFPILPEGYIDLPKDYEAAIPVGAAPAGSSVALFTITLDFASAKGRTMTAFAIGKKGDGGFPIKALLCEESKDAGVLASCVQF
jgi:hypothetical protein